MSLRDLFSLVPGGANLYDNKIAKNSQGNTKSKSKSPADEDVSLSLTVEDALPFDKVIGNIVKNEKGKYCTISKTNAINLEDMDEEDIALIIQQYADFNNSLNSVLQIYIPSFTMDIRKHLNFLEQREEQEDSEAIKEWLQDDIDFQKELIEENDIIDTQFYIINTTEFNSTNDEYKDFLKAKKILSKNAKYTSDELEGIGLKTNQLNYQGIGKLLYYALNPFSAGKQEPHFDNLVISGDESYKKAKNKRKPQLDQENISFDLTDEETNYLEQGGMTFKEKIAPYSLNDKISPDFIKSGSAYMTVYEIYDYPLRLPKLWAKKLYKYRQNIDISLFIKPVPTSKIVKELNKAAIDYGSSLIDIQTGQKKKATTMIEKKMDASAESISQTMDKLDSGEESFFHFSAFILAKGRTLDELNDICLELENVLGGMRLSFRKCTDNMRNALWTMLPLGINHLGTYRDMLTSGVANSFSFQNYSFSHREHEKNFFLAVQKHNSTLIHFNPYVLINGHFGILGISGSGKSNTSKKIIKGVTGVLDIPFTYVDPQGETTLKVYDQKLHRDTSFAESMDAKVYDYFIGSPYKFNVLEPEPDPEKDSLLKPHINFVKIFFKSIMPDLTNDDLSILGYALALLYKEKGFTDNKESYWDIGRKDENLFILDHNLKPRRKPPELIEFHDFLKLNALKKEMNIDTENYVTKFREWTRLGSVDLFDGPTTIDFKEKRKIINLKHLDKMFKEPACLVLFQKLWDRKRMNPDILELIFTDELHYFIRNDAIAEYILEILKRLRMFGGMFGFSTQNISELLKSKWAAEMIKNCGWTVLMKQAKEDAMILKDMYQMTRSEAIKMTMFNHQKGEGYLIVDGQRIPINVKISPKEKITFTTNPTDLQKMEMQRREDAEKGLYFKI